MTNDIIAAMSDSPSATAPPANGGHSWNEMNTGDGRIQELDARMKELQSMIEAKDASMQELQSKIVAKENALCEKNAFILKCHKLLEAIMQAIRAAGIDDAALQAILAAERDMNASNASSWY